MTTHTAARDKSRVTTNAATLDDRTRRALEECMSVLDDVGGADPEAGLYTVVGENGGTYLVDTIAGACECPDSEYREPDGGCKHVRRARFATGQTAVPAAANVELDDRFADHVDAEIRVAATDGAGATEIVDAGDDAEILDDGPDEWCGPFPEHDRYGNPTGEKFVQCPECGVEVLEQNAERATHADGCGFEKASR